MILKCLYMRNKYLTQILYIVALNVFVHICVARWKLRIDLQSNFHSEIEEKIRKN